MPIRRWWVERDSQLRFARLMREARPEVRARTVGPRPNRPKACAGDPGRARQALVGPGGGSELMAARRATGHVRLARGKRGDRWYLKYRLPDGRQVQNLLGPAWTGNGRPAAGHYTRRMAEEALQNVLADARRGTLARMHKIDATFTDAAAEYLRYVEEVRVLARAIEKTCKKARCYGRRAKRVPLGTEIGRARCRAGTCRRGLPQRHRSRRRAHLRRAERIAYGRRNTVSVFERQVRAHRQRQHLVAPGARRPAARRPRSPRRRRRTGGVGSDSG